MEFLRFGSSIPGHYWGCCASCIIQNFKVDPDAKASIQIVNGDSGAASGDKFAGPTWKDIFWQRIRYGTFDTRDMPNHTFFAILAKSQLSPGGVGLKWLAILKEAGFEFVRTVNNSVWNVDNYIFMLNRNVGGGKLKDMFTPPKAWTDLPTKVTEPWTLLGDLPGLTKTISTEQKAIWDEIPPTKFYTQKELEDLGVPVTLAGRRVNWAKPNTPDMRAKLKLQYDEGVLKLASASKPQAGSAAPVQAVFPKPGGIDVI